MSFDSALPRCSYVSRFRGLRRLRCSGLIGLWLVSICGPAQSAVSQTLNLGDPKPPPATEMVACRHEADQLRREARAMRPRASTDSSAAELCVAAQIRWREIASLLLEQPDPLQNAEIVMLGWMLAERGEELDEAIDSLAPAGELISEQRADAMWELKRFVAMPLHVREGDTASPAWQPTAPVDMAEIRAAIRPLVDALDSATGSAPAAGGPLAERLAAAAALVADDPSLAPLQSTLDRYAELCMHAGWRTEAELALSGCLDFIDNVRTLDSTSWLGAVWTPLRADRIATSIERLAASEAQAGAGPAADISEMAGCVRAVNGLLNLPPGSRPQLDPFRKVIVRWVGESSPTNQSRPWPLLAEALESMENRCANASAVSQRELAIACNALDEQSDQLERMMGEWLNRPGFASRSSDPEWATVIGQHRDNVRTRRMLTELPDAVDWLGRFDRRAASAIWPRLLPDARSTHDPRARESLLVKAREIVGFYSRYSELPSESEWRTGGDSLSPLVGASRERILARLDALRKSRASEIINGTASSAVQSQLDALRDLFKFVEIEPRLNSARALSSRACLPAEFVATESQRFQSTLQRLLDLAPEGGAAFVRAVEAARGDAANAIVLAPLADAAEGGSSDAAVLSPLAAIARSAAWPSAPRGAASVRVAQWKMLQFELARQSDDHGVVPEDLRLYAPFLAARLAEAIWDQSR